MSITFCTYKSCEKANQCKRYLEKGDTEILFKNICHKDNNYEWFQQTDIAVVKKEDNINKENNKDSN